MFFLVGLGNETGTLKQKIIVYWHHYLKRLNSEEQMVLPTFCLKVYCFVVLCRLVAKLI